MKILLSFLLFSCSLLFLHAQDQSACTGDRYRSEIFVSTDSTLAVKYGENVTIGGNAQELFMDIYEPAGDTVTQRPLIILAFGGSFISGDRKQLKALCEDLSRRGFVTASIDYRLFDGSFIPFPTQADIVDVVIKAISDMRASVRFWKAEIDSINAFRIDPDQIFIGGVSAGAITAAHVAMLDSTELSPADSLIQQAIANNGGWEGNSNTLFQYTSEVQGLISYSGALVDASWIDANDPPFVVFHDDMDPIVPYGDGQIQLGIVPILEAAGSLSMSQRGDSIGVFNRLFTIEDSDGHVSYFTTTEELRDSVGDFTSDFLFELLCPDLLANVEGPLSQRSKFAAYPNPTNDYLYIQSDNLAAISSIQLLNSLGQRVGRWTVREAINLTEMEAGMYMLEIIYVDNTQAERVKILKQ
ncbi:MAG: T9SS type A sorting domain-containing protein [Bacteroidota bacterium]